jgi:hypothetical protein
MSSIGATATAQANRMAERHYRHGCGQRALDRLHHLQQERREVGIIFFKIADMAGAIAIAAPLRRALAAPIQAHDLETSRAKLIRHLAVFFEEFRVAVQDHADGAFLHARRELPNPAAQMSFVWRRQRERAKLRSHHLFLRLKGRHVAAI